MGIQSSDTMNPWIKRYNDEEDVIEVDVNEYKDFAYWYIDAYNYLKENKWVKKKNYWLSPEGNVKIYDTEEAVRVCKVLMRERRPDNTQ